jgi:NAD-dependent SIR2 family protein deacetylase
MEPYNLLSKAHHLRELRGDEIVTPLRIEETEVADVMRNGRVLIYTGAGVSLASGVPDMRGLIACLGVDGSKRVDEFARLVMLNQPKMRRRLAVLQESFYGKPTPAHHALAQIQALTGVRVATENLDVLGETAGQEIIKREKINKALPDAELSKLDCIVTVGLRADDSGLLLRYKQVKPNGKFIALNLEPPLYLDETDYFLEGDVQKTVPKIRELIALKSIPPN